MLFKGGFKNNSPVELIDIFPTICKLAGIPAPDYLDGISLFPILNRDSQNIKKFAIKLLDRFGNIIDFNNMDWSFSIEFETLYENII